MVGYYVNIQEPGEITAHGPSALPRAKDFARIGSQTGGDRVITRGFRGPVVRIYSGGKRLWPLDLSQAAHLKRSELPRSLVSELEHTVAMAANPWPEGWAEAQRARGALWAPPPKTRKDQLIQQIIDDSFCQAYVAAMLWSSHDDRDDDSGGGPYLDENFGLNDFTVDGLERIIANCEAFLDMPGVDDAIGSDYERAGHDFWLTQAGHGAGFWDGDWSPEAEEVLMDATNQFDELAVYVGDNGKLYFSEA